MSKRFLIVGNSTIAHSIIQVFNLLDSLQFEHLESSDLAGLESFNKRNDINGIILTPPDEVELAKHIRLTESLGNLRLLPIMILSPHSLEHHLREKRDNIFLLSPEVYLISISECIAELLNVMEKARHFESQKKMCADLKPFIVWSEEDDIVSSHDNFNRYGPFRLMQEHFGGLPEFMSAQYGDISSRLWFKKYRFLESNSITAEALQVDEEQFRKTIANKKVLYIDDEHRLGWSFALYSLFTGNSDQSHYQVFQDSASVISTPDSRFTSIDNVQDARNVIETYHDALSRALAEYSDAEHHRNRLAVDTSDIRKNTREIEDKVKSAEASVSRAGTSLREAEEKIRELNESFKKTVDTHGQARGTFSQNKLRLT